jgi:hypothetical protein
MSDDPKTEPTPEPSPEADPAKSFWEEFEKRIDGVIDRRMAQFQKSQPPGTSRTGRSTLPGILAELMGGPFTKKG